MLFLVKIVRATNDNVASMYYNATEGLVSYFWIGFAISVFSILCTFLVVVIHESVIEEPETETETEIKEGDEENKEPKTKAKEENESLLQVVKRLPPQYFCFMVVYGAGYAGIHAFYPNMSKFFQQKFQFTNVDAGHIAAIPYLVASFCTPAFGSVLNKIGDTFYESLLFVCIATIFMIHSFYMVKGDSAVGEEGSFLVIGPMFLFGIAHACFTVLNTPMTQKLVSDKQLLPTCFALLTISQNIFVMIIT